MTTKKRVNFTQEEMIRRTRILSALEKVSADLRPLLYAADVPSEKKDDIADFLMAWDRTRIVFSARETCSDMPIEGFIRNKILRTLMKEHEVRRLSHFLATPEAKYRALCKETDSRPSEYLIMLHRAYQHAAAVQPKQQAWFSTLFRE